MACTGVSAQKSKQHLFLPADQMCGKSEFASLVQNTIIGDKAFRHLDLFILIYINMLAVYLDVAC